MIEREPRWPVLLAILSCGALNWLLPESMSAGPGWVVVALAGVQGVCSLLTVDGSEKLHLIFAYGTQVVVTLSLAFAVYTLLSDVLAKKVLGSVLLQGAIGIWSLNVLVFATWYWRLDAGGPVQRRRHHSYREGAFLFPQATLSKDARELLEIHNWHPQFLDYLFISFNTSTAFSPTDSPVLSRWAKGMMMLQSTIALTSIALIAGRAINIL